MKLSQAITYFKKWGIGEYADNTLNTYSHCLRRFEEWTGNKNIEDIELFADIMRFRDYLDTQNKKEGTINTTMVALRQLFKLLSHTQGEFDLNLPFSWDAIPTKSKVQQKSYTPITQKQHIALVNQAIKRSGVVGRRDEAILRMFWSTGVRVSEMIEMNIGNVNLPDEQSVTVTTKKRRDGVEKRTVPFTEYCKKALEKYLKMRESLDGEALWISTRGPVAGDRLSVRSVQRMITKYAEHANIKKNISPHSYRHALGQRGANNKMDKVLLADMLGHSTPASSDTYYNVKNPVMQNEYHDKIGDNSDEENNSWAGLTDILELAGSKIRIF